MLLNGLFTSSSQTGAPTGAVANHRGSLLSSCSPPVPRAGPCPTSPPPAPGANARENHLLYQVEPASVQRGDSCASGAPPPQGPFLTFGGDFVRLFVLFVRFAHPHPHHALTRFLWDRFPCLRPRNEGGSDHRGAHHTPPLRREPSLAARGRWPLSAFIRVHLWLSRFHPHSCRASRRSQAAPCRIPRLGVRCHAAFRG
jgi:hypothetical protein